MNSYYRNNSHWFNIKVAYKVSVLVLVILFIAYNTSHFISQHKNPMYGDISNINNLLYNLTMDDCFNNERIQLIINMIKQHGKVIRDRNSSIHVFLPKHSRIMGTKVNLSIDFLVNHSDRFDRYKLFGEMVLEPLLEDLPVERIDNDSHVIFRPDKFTEIFRSCYLSPYFRYMGAKVSNDSCNNTTTLKSHKIPRHIWIANCTPKKGNNRLENLAVIQEYNPCWEIHVFGCEDQQKYIEKYFNGSKLLETYNLINPHLPAAQADIWRLAVLYRHGGVYLDLDVKFDIHSFKHGTLDEIINVEDEAIFAQEKSFYFHEMTNGEYSRYVPDSHPLRVGLNLSYIEFPNRRMISTWMLISKPNHIIYKQALENLVELVSDEFHCRSSVLLCPYCSKNDKIWFNVGPVMVTSTIRQVVWQSLHNISSSYYNRNVSFTVYPIQNFDGTGFQHFMRRSYTRSMNRDKVRLLRSYANSSCKL